MCVGLPQQVVDSNGFVAICEGEGRLSEVEMGLVGPQPPGTWVMTFLGSARQVLDEQTARRILDARQALQRIRSGETNVDDLFADLVNREPELPDGVQRPASERSKSLSP